MKEKIVLASFGHNPVLNQKYNFLYIHKGKNENGLNILETVKGGKRIEMEDENIREASHFDMSTYFWGN